MDGIERITAGIDWLSGSLARGVTNEHQFVRNGQQAIETIAEEGYDLKMRGLLGYKGISAGNCFIGSRDDSHYVQLTGHHAHRWFSHTYRADMHVSRIDIQATVMFSIERASIAQKGYRDAVLASGLLPIGRQRKIYLISGSDGGDTVYIGAPSSAQRGRCYNKAKQSGEQAFERSWRYEVTLRDDLSVQCADKLATSQAPIEEHICAIIAAWYGERGVKLTFLEREHAVVLPRARTLPTDVERKLQWIRHQVLPSIRWLRERGYAAILNTLLQGDGDDTTPSSFPSE